VAEQQVKQKKEDVFRIRRARPHSTADADRAEPNTLSLESKEPQRPSTGIRGGVSKTSPDDIKARFRTELDVTVSGGRSHRGSADVNLPVPSVAKETIPAAPAEPNSQTEPIAPDQTPEEEAPPQPQLSIRARTWHLIGRIWPWLLAALAVPIAGVGYLAVKDYQKAKIWIIKKKTNLKNKRQEEGMVVAKLNGRTYHLGTKSRLPVVHIGSGVNNTIRIPEKGISDRHLRIYRQGPNLMIQNIGTTPVTVRDQSLPPKARQRLMLPAVIELTKNTKLNLSLKQSKDISTSEGKKDHEQTKKA
jgi:hypothetical protein